MRGGGGIGEGQGEDGGVGQQSRGWCRTMGQEPR